MYRPSVRLWLLLVTPTLNSSAARWMSMVLKSTLIRISKRAFSTWNQLNSGGIRVSTLWVAVIARISRRKQVVFGILASHKSKCCYYRLAILLNKFYSATVAEVLARRMSPREIFFNFFLYETMSFWAGTDTVSGWIYISSSWRHWMWHSSSLQWHRFCQWVTTGVRAHGLIRRKMSTWPRTLRNTASSTPL